MTAISGISAATGAINTALEQFDRALISTVTTVQDATVSGTSARVQVPDGLAGMDTARLAVQAAIAAANASISMIDEVLKLADYGGDKKDSDSQPQQQSASQAQDPAQSAQLYAIVQSIRAQAMPQPEESPAPAASAQTPSQGSESD